MMQYIHKNYPQQISLQDIAKAVMLSTTQSSVSAIARDTGFENIGYFCRRFKKTFGVTPGEYRMKTSL